MAEGGHEAVVGVFRDRDRLEKALEGLQSNGFNRSQLSILATDRPASEAVRSGSFPISEERQEKPIDRAELGNVQGLAGAIPAYLGAVIAAGVTVASGGALAGVAIAALAGGAAGVGAARMLREDLDSTYEEQLATGGIILIAWTRHAGDEDTARRIMAECGATDIAPIVTDPTHHRAITVDDA